MLKRTDSGVSSDCASVDWAHLAGETAKGINNTDLLKLMMTQKRVFVHDEKNHFTVAANETLLSSMKIALDDVPGKPSMKHFQTYVEAMNTFFLCGLSGTDCKGKLHTQWVRNNAYQGKSLYTKFLRKERRPVRTPMKKAGLKKPLVKPPLLTINLEKKDVGWGSSTGSVLEPHPTEEPQRRRLKCKTSDPDTVQVVSMEIKCKGKHLLQWVPHATCSVCHGIIARFDDCIATGIGDEVKHENCLNTSESLLEARGLPAVAPSAGSCLRADLAAKKQAAKIEREALPSTWTEEKAIHRHGELMKIAKPLQKVGLDKAWRMRYEPIKNKTWMRTRHQVVLRKKSDDTSKSWSFKFSEHTDSDAEFERRLVAAFDECFREHAGA